MLFVVKVLFDQVLELSASSIFLNSTSTYPYVQDAVRTITQASSTTTTTTTATPAVETNAKQTFKPYTISTEFDATAPKKKTMDWPKSTNTTNSTPPDSVKLNIKANNADRKHSWSQDMEESFTVEKQTHNSNTTASSRLSNWTTQQQQRPSATVEQVQHAATPAVDAEQEQQQYAEEEEPFSRSSNNRGYPRKRGNNNFRGNRARGRGRATKKYKEVTSESQ